MQRRVKNSRYSNNLKHFVSPTEEIDKINKLKIERELKELENSDIIKGLEENRLNLSKLISYFKEIEEENNERIEKAQNEFLTILSAIDLKASEFRTLDDKVFSLLNTEDELLRSIPILENKKVKLEKEIEEKISNYNVDKNNSELYLRTLSGDIEKNTNKLNKLKEELKNTQNNFDELIDKINKENEVLSVKQKDVEIYETRLRVKYPDAKIIL